MGAGLRNVPHISFVATAVNESHKKINYPPEICTCLILCELEYNFSESQTFDDPYVQFYISTQIY